MQATTSDNVSDAYKEEMMAIKSRDVYDMWWTRYCGYVEGRHIDVKAATSLLNWMCSLKPKYE